MPDARPRSAARPADREAAAAYQVPPGKAGGACAGGRRLLLRPVASRAAGGFLTESINVNAPSRRRRLASACRAVRLDRPVQRTLRRAASAAGASARAGCRRSIAPRCQLALRWKQTRRGSDHRHTGHSLTHSTLDPALLRVATGSRQQAAAATRLDPLCASASASAVDATQLACAKLGVVLVRNGAAKGSVCDSLQPIMG